MPSKMLAKLIIAFSLVLTNLAIADDDPLAPPKVDSNVSTPVALEPRSGESAPPAPVGQRVPEKPEVTPSNNALDGILGEALITESRRENGTPYLIELEHSSGSKQYIEDNDADGLTESSGEDLEKTPSLAKWRLGSW